MKLTPATFHFSLCGLLCLSVLPLYGQARIDPSLPSAPLPNKGRSYLFPDFETVRNPRRPVPPLTAKQKFEIAYRTVASPSFVIDPLVITGFEEATNLGPDYGPGPDGAAELFGSNAATLATTTFFTDGLLPVVFHQDPRYFRKGTGSFKERMWWAIRADAVAYSDTGKEMPNYSSMLGLGASAALSDVYLPSENVSFGQTMESWGIKESVRAGSNVLREFGGVGWLKKKLRRRQN